MLDELVVEVLWVRSYRFHWSKVLAQQLVLLWELLWYCAIARCYKRRLVESFSAGDHNLL